MKIDSIRSEIVYKAKYRLESAPRKKWSSGLIVSTVGLVDKDGDLCITHIRDVTSDLRNGEFFEEVSDEEKASAVRSIDEDKTQNPPENVFGNNLHVYPKTKSMNFSNGYRLYDYDGNCIKKVNRSAWIQIKAISAENKFASKPAYLSEWSYLQLLEGKKPNWIINLDGN